MQNEMGPWQRITNQIKASHTSLKKPKTKQYSFNYTMQVTFALLSNARTSASDNKSDILSLVLSTVKCYKLSLTLKKHFSDIFSSI